MKRLIFAASIIIAVFFLAPNSASAQMTGERTILDLGCHLVDNTCFATISGVAVGGSYRCSSTSVRWDTSEQAGRNILTLVINAKDTGKTVSFNIVGCYPNQIQFPTFNYMTSK